MKTPSLTMPPSQPVLLHACCVMVYFCWSQEPQNINLYSESFAECLLNQGILGGKIAFLREELFQRVFLSAAAVPGQADGY